MPSTEFTKDKIRRHMLGTASWTKPAAMYIALFTAQGEVVAASYARVQRNPADANWTFPSTSGQTGEGNNTAAVTFNLPGINNWGVVIAAALYDDPAAGNQVAYGLLTQPKTINAGDPAPTFPAGTLKFTVG